MLRFIFPSVKAAIWVCTSTEHPLESLAPVFAISKVIDPFGLARIHPLALLKGSGGVVVELLPQMTSWSLVCYPFILVRTAELIISS